MQKLFSWTLRSRALPWYVRSALATVFVLATAAIRMYFSESLSAAPFLLFFVPILFSALVLDRGSGFVAVTASAAVVSYFFLEPIGSFAIYDPAHLTTFALFLLIATVSASVIEALHVAYKELDRRRQALAESEARFRIIVEGARDYAIMTTDTAGRITSWSPGAETVFGYAPQEIIGRAVDILFTEEDRAAGIPGAERETARQRGYAPDVRWHLRKSGERFWIDGAAWPLRDARGDETGFLKVGRDATQARSAELLMQDAVERQALVTREVGHRIKNNLAIVSSLLTLQARNTGNEETRTALSDARGRIEAIAQVHDQLWRQEQSETIDLDAYLGDLCERVQRTMPHHRLTYTGDGCQAPVPIDDAVTMSLIVNELITNAAKYAYPQQEGGPIAVRLSCEAGESLRIEVADAGVGLPKHIAAGELKSGSLGMRMLRTLSRQLDAELAIDTGADGTRVAVTIPRGADTSQNATAAENLAGASQGL